MVETSVARIALRWKMTRNRPTAVMAIISAAMISVTQAAAGMTVLLSCSAEKLRDGTRVPDCADSNFPDGAVGRGQRFRDAVEFPGEAAVQQEDDVGKYHEQQDGVADPPQDHGAFSLARGVVRHEEATEDPAQRHQRGPQAEGEALRRRG